MLTLGGRANIVGRLPALFRLVVAGLRGEGLLLLFPLLLVLGRRRGLLLVLGRGGQGGLVPVL